VGEIATTGDGSSHRSAGLGPVGGYQSVHPADLEVSVLVSDR